MIKTFTHKGLEAFFRTGSTKGIQAKHAFKLSLILDRLDAATSLRDVHFPGSGLHPLQGNLTGHWSVRVSGNWRVTFRLEDGDVHVVNYLDYH
ncbi:MAG TPA: peptidase [Desulfomicrobium sp.]|nr:peptidase [Desulfomicrobium sp.]